MNEEKNNSMNGQPDMPPEMIRYDTPCGQGAAAYPQMLPKIGEETVFTKTERILAFAAAGLAFLFVHFVLWHTAGFFTTMFYIALFTAVIVFLRKSGCTFKGSHKVWVGVMFLFSAVFSLTANETIKLLDVIFLQIGGAYLVYAVTSQSGMFGRFAIFELLKCVFENPFAHFGKEYSAVNSTFKGSRTGSNIKAVVGGSLLAVPLTLIVAGLLMSADEGVAQMLGSLAETVSVDNLFSLVGQIAVTFPVAGYLFGLLYSHTHRDKIRALNEEDCEARCRVTRVVANTAVYTAVTPICILYVMFFISQANYFLSAFLGSLPENYSYAEYARRGFFELFAIELINGGVIFFINFFAKKTGEEKPFTLKLYSVVISVFTLLITSTAISKMVMYIQNFGLTQLRVYTTWFMTLTAVMFVYVIIRQFKRSFPFMKAAAATFTLMFALLCFSRPDAVIARYNMEFCAEQLTYRDIMEMNELSADASAVLLEPKYRAIEDVKFEDMGYLQEDRGSGYEYLRTRTEDRLSRSPYNEYNISAVMIRARLSK